MSYFVEEAEPSCADVSGNKKRQKLQQLEYLTEAQPAVSVILVA